MSATLPGLSTKASGRPVPSVKAWIILVGPPRERPMACAAAPLSAGRGVLRRGEKGEAVWVLRMRLAGRGCAAGAPDGWYGNATEQAVRAAQRELGLAVDGVVGPRTAKAPDFDW